jgi:Cu(I)/Ag(I) efflux system membrane protein CusA/SilA
MQAARARLLVIVPLAGVLIILLLYMATNSWLRVGLLLLSLPFSMVGAIWLLYLLDYNLSLAVWVGVIALAGLAAETGLVMLLYLDNSFERFRDEGRMRNADDLWYAVHDGAVQRIRPKTMTVMTTLMALLPLLWASGAGADTMRRLAVPMIGGLITAYIGVLLIIPVLYSIARRVAMHREFRKQGAGPAAAQPAA